MPLFRCTKCGCVENTALSHYWLKGEAPALCCECDPKIAKWHQRFPKRPATGLILVSDGFLHHLEDDLSFRIEHQGLKILGFVKEDGTVESS